MKAMEFVYQIMALMLAYGIITAMNLLEEISNSSLEATLREAVLATLNKVDLLLEQTRQDAATIHAAELKIQALTLELAHHRRIRFGIKNESLTTEQLSLFEENWSEDEGEIQSAIEPLQSADDKKPAKRPRAGRQALPDHLPREIHVHEPASCQCGQCGADMVKVGEDVTEQLDVLPA